MGFLTRLSELPEVSDLDPAIQRRVWRRAVAMALKHPPLPMLTIGFVSVVVVAVNQAGRLERHVFLPLFGVFIIVTALIFNQAMARIVRPHLRGARMRERPE